MTNIVPNPLENLLLSYGHTFDENFFLKK